MLKTLGDVSWNAANTTWQGRRPLFSDDFDYLHMLDGRLRVKVPEVKRSRTKALEVEQVLGRLKGVTQVRANPLTGNVLVLYSPQVITPSRILDTLKSVDCFAVSGRSRQAAHPLHAVYHHVSRSVVQSVAEIALERAFLALL
jgi:copper chaperone CopZ